MMLFEEGHFLLTDPIAKYLPEFAEMEVYLRERDGEIRDRACGTDHHPATGDPHRGTYLRLFPDARREDVRGRAGRTQ